MMKKADNQLLVIFGASGDLTKRKLLPSLFELYVRNLLPEKFRVLGASRTAFTDEEFREEQRKAILDSPEAKPYDPEQVGRFLQLVHYLSFDSTNEAEYGKLKERIEQLQQQNGLDDRIIYYLATPPVMYESVPVSLQKQGLNKPRTREGWRRIIVEKPFGTNLESAERLGEKLRKIFPEENIYRIDHYLGKETVQNILVLRFANGIFEPLWNRNYIDSVEISATETLGVENRGKYYEGAGALRDMIQNHLMQLMAFVAMENPAVDPRRNRQSVPRHPPLLAHGNLERRDPGAIHRPHGRRHGTTGLPGRERCCRRLDDRDLCGDETLYRQLALGRRALLFLHGQADGRKEVGDRDQLQIDPDANVCRTMLRQFLQQTDDPDSAERRHYA